MSASTMKVYIHAIFATKDKNPLINASLEKEIHQILVKEFEEINCPVLSINGMADHIHVLFAMSTEKSIAQIMKQVKGSSSHKINRGDYLACKFAWQKGYGAFSVSQSNVKQVRDYIRKQKVYHQNFSFAQEFKRIKELYGVGGNG